MDARTIVDLRKKAEEAVSDMSEGPLKLKAFEVILERLMVGQEGRSNPSLVEESRDSQQRNEGSRPNASSAIDRISLLRDENFFQEQRSIGEVREKLASRGWHYPVTSLSGPMQALVQRGVLRRMKINGVWKYSLP